MTLLTDKQREEVVEAAFDALWPLQNWEMDPNVCRAAAQAALTAALPAIERAVREDLRVKLARANESLGSVHCPVMNGDNLAVSLCSYFDEGDEWPEGDGADDCGWSPSAVDGYTQTIDAIRQHYIRALAGEVG